MRGDDIDLEEMLGPDPMGREAEDQENLVDVAPPGAINPSQALLERSRSYPMPRRSKKNTLERLIRILGYAREMPVIADICRRAEISNTTLKYWLQKSKDGGPRDGFDIPLGDNDESDDGDTIRFHLAFNDAVEAGVDTVEAVGHTRATGYEEPQVYQGRVQYKLDPVIVATYVELGLPVNDRDPNLWLRDAAGAPIAETVVKIDPDLLMFILKARKPTVYGAKASVDINVKGGVLVVPMRAVAAADLNVIEDQYRKQGRPTVTFEEGDEDEDV